MAKISKMIEIDAPAERVFAFLTDPNNLPEIWPSMIEVSNVVRKPDGWQSFDWVYKMAGIHFRGHSDTLEVEKNKSIVLKNTGIPSEFRYLYETVGGKTRLTMNVEYTVPGQVLGKLAAPIVHLINEHEAETLLKNLKVRVELEQEAGKEAQPAAVH